MTSVLLIPSPVRRCQWRRDNAIESTRPFDQQNARAYAYIGMSRARGALVVLAQEDLREEVESRLGD